METKPGVSSQALPEYEAFYFPPHKREYLGRATVSKAVGNNRTRARVGALPSARWVRSRGSLGRERGREDEGFGGERGSMGDTVHIRNLQKFSALCYHTVMGPVGSPGCITPGCSHLPPLLWCHCPRKVMVSGILLAAG